MNNDSSFALARARQADAIRLGPKLPAPAITAHHPLRGIAWASAATRCRSLSSAGSVYLPNPAGILALVMLSSVPVLLFALAVQPVFNGLYGTDVNRDLTIDH